MAGIVTPDTPAVMAAKPTTVPAAPNRSASEVDALAAKQRAKFSAPGSFTKNYFTGGEAAGPVSTVTKTLGGVI